MLKEIDPFFLNPIVCNKTKEILSLLNIPLLDYQSLLVDYEDLSIINQLHSTPYKTAYKAFYQQKIVLAEVYNHPHPSQTDSPKESQMNGPSQSSVDGDGKISLMIQLSIRKALSHENFVGLLGVGYFQYHVDQPVQILVLSEYHEKNLDDIIRLEREEGYTSSWKEKLTWMKEILSGLLLLEKYSITIKELTLQNIFISNQLKIKMKPEYEIINHKPVIAVSEEEKSSRRPSSTTPPHVVFSFGKIIFLLLTGISFQEFCSSSPTPTIDAAPVSDGCPEALRSLMLRCLEYNGSHSVATILTIQMIWKEIDDICNMTFPPENPSNQLLRRVSHASASSTKLMMIRSTSSDSQGGFNPFDDVEDYHHNRGDRDGMMSHRPLMVPRRPTVPSQDTMDHIFSHFSQLPPRHSHSQQNSHPYQHRRPSTQINSHHSNNPFSSHETSPLLSPTLHLPPSIPTGHQSLPPSSQTPSVYFDRREDILQHVINTLGRQLHVIESDLHENLEIVENLYIVEASPQRSNPAEKTKKKEEVKHFRQTIETFFHQVESIKKQLVFLYLYCDLEEEPEKELRSSLKRANDESPAAPENPFLGFEQNEASRRQSQLKLLQLLQEVLNDNPTSNAPTPSTEDIYEFYRRNSHSLSSKEFKKRLSLLRQEATSTATNISSDISPSPSKGNSASKSQRNSSAHTLPPNNSINPAPTVNGSKTSSDRSMSSGSDHVEGIVKEMNKSPSIPQEIRKSLAPKEEKKSVIEMKGDFLAEIRKKGTSSDAETVDAPTISIAPKKSITLPPQEVQETKEEVVESKAKAPSLKPAVSLSARLFNQFDEPMTTEDLTSTTADPALLSVPAPPLSPPLTATSTIPEPAKTTQKSAGGHVRRTSSYEALTQFNRGKSSNSTAMEPANNPVNALQKTVAPPPAPPTNTGNSKISGLVVGRKNSLIPVDNHTAAQMKQRKASLYLGSKVTEGDLDSTSGDMQPSSGFLSNISPMGKIFGGGFQQEELDDYSYNNADNIVPFSSSTTPSAGFTAPSKQSNNTTTSGPIHFIYGRQIGGNQGPPSPSADIPTHPIAARKNPIEKATEFINRVKQLDSMYLTRAHDPYDETLNNRDPALAEELLNSNMSYLHQHTFTGALNRPINSPEGGTKKEHLTTALTSFLKVIEKCQDTSSKAKSLVHQMDHGISQIGLSNSTGALGAGSVANGIKGTGGVRSVSPTTLPRHMSPTYSASRKLSPKAIQKANARINALSSTFAPSDSLSHQNYGAPATMKRSVSPASTLSGSVTNSGRRAVGGVAGGNVERNFFDNDEPNPLTNSFQSLYNVNNNTSNTTNMMSGNASISSYGRSSSPSKARSKSPRIRYSIHKETLSKNKSPVTFSFSPSKRR